jgi:transposase-like protein
MYPKAAHCLSDDLDVLLNYWKFPVEHHKHLRTTNVIESPFATVRLRTDATKRLRTARSGVHLIYQVLKRAQQNWRRLSAPEKLREVPLPDEKQTVVQKEKVV